MTTYHALQLAGEFFILPGLSFLWRIEKRLNKMEAKMSDFMTRKEYQKERIHEWISRKA